MSLISQCEMLLCVFVLKICFGFNFSSSISHLYAFDVVRHDVLGAKLAQLKLPPSVLQ